MLVLVMVMLFDEEDDDGNGAHGNDVDDVLPLH